MLRAILGALYMRVIALTRTSFTQRKRLCLGGKSVATGVLVRFKFSDRFVAFSVFAFVCDAGCILVNVNASCKYWTVAPSHVSAVSSFVETMFVGMQAI